MNLRASVGAAVVVILAAACGTGGPPTASPPSRQPTTPSAITTAIPIDAPPATFATALPTAGPTERPYPTQPIQPPPTGVDEHQLPPDAELMDADAERVTGIQGSWCYQNACADRPAPRKMSLPIMSLPSDYALTFTLDDRHRFSYIRVTYASRSDSDDQQELATAGTSDQDAASSEPPLKSFEFVAPPVGDWVVTAFVYFPDHAGDASYYWRVVSEDPFAEADEAPAAALWVGDEGTHGQPGTYCYKDTCVDGPFPPKENLPRIEIRSGAELLLALEEARFVGWSVAYGESSNDDSSTELDSGGTSDPDAADEDFDEVSFPAPPTGNWVLFAWLQLRQGDLSYAWHVIVM